MAEASGEGDDVSVGDGVVECFDSTAQVACLWLALLTGSHHDARLVDVYVELGGVGVGSDLPVEVGACRSDGGSSRRQASWSSAQTLSDTALESGDREQGD